MPVEEADAQDRSGGNSSERTQLCARPVCRQQSMGIVVGFLLLSANNTRMSSCRYRKLPIHRLTKPQSQSKRMIGEVAAVRWCCWSVVMMDNVWRVQGQGRSPFGSSSKTSVSMAAQLLQGCAALLGDRGTRRDFWRASAGSVSVPRLRSTVSALIVRL